MALYHDKNHCESYYGRGSCYDALEQYTEALKDYNKALELFSEYTDVWYAKADVLFNIQDIQGSLDCYHTALQLNPEDNECRLDYGLTLAESKQFEKAEEQFVYLINHNAEWYAAYYELAKIKHIHNNENTAKELLKKAISLDKTKVEEMQSDFLLYCKNNQLKDLFSQII
jgi:tetratricopeptide (TPR) repeat protein